MKATVSLYMKTLYCALYILIYYKNYYVAVLLLNYYYNYASCSIIVCVPVDSKDPFTLVV